MKRRIINAILDILYPRKCPVCDQIVSPSGALICPACRGQINFIREPRCKKCGKAILFVDREYCDDCERHEHRFAYGLALMNYDDTARKILLDLKYHNKRDNADYLAAEMAVRLKREIYRMQGDMLIPVPVHRVRKRIRGFNQAELLAKKLSERLDIPVRTDVLARVRNTQPQKELGSVGRLNNLLRAFAVRNMPAIQGKRIILVDDIYTTGSTAEACSRVLLEAGAAQVYLLNGAVGENH